jgi:predicted nucleotidyltransferase
MNSDRVDHARRLVSDRFPDALGAVLAGSVALGHATASSDLDIAVLIAEDGQTCRETVRIEGRVVEFFVHTAAGLAELFTADAASRRGVMQSMYASGVVLADAHGHAERTQARAVADLLAGPPALEQETIETKRYGLTDLLADLGDSHDRIERLAVASAILSSAADLLCDYHRAWVGTGKWMPRRLLEADEERGMALLDGHRRLCESDDQALFADTVAQILDLVGGPLSEGYRKTWPSIMKSADAGN